MHLSGCAEYPPIPVLWIAIGNSSCHRCPSRYSVNNSLRTGQLVRKAYRLALTIQSAHVQPPRPRGVSIAHASACLIPRKGLGSTILAKILAEAGYLGMSLKLLRHSRNIVHHGAHRI